MGRAFLNLQPWKVPTSGCRFAHTCVYVRIHTVHVRTYVHVCKIIGHNNACQYHQHIVIAEESIKCCTAMHLILTISCQQQYCSHCTYVRIYATTYISENYDTVTVCTVCKITFWYEHTYSVCARVCVVCVCGVYVCVCVCVCVCVLSSPHEQSCPRWQV